MITEFKSEQFSYDTGIRRFFADASSLGLRLPLQYTSDARPGLIPYEINLLIGNPGKLETFTLEFIDKDGNILFLANGPLNALGVEVKIYNN